MTRYPFRKSQMDLVCGALSAFLRGSSISCNTMNIPRNLPVVMVIWQSEIPRITFLSSMKSRGVGRISSTLLMTAISHPIITPLLITIYIIIYIPILIIISLDPLLTVTLASATASIAASTTTPTSCALLCDLLYIGLVTRMQEIWSVVLSATIFTWAFSLVYVVLMIIWDVQLVGNI